MQFHNFYFFGLLILHYPRILLIDILVLLIPYFLYITQIVHFLGYYLIRDTLEREKIINGLEEIVSGNLVLREHEAAKWLIKDELDSVAWLTADVTLVEKIKNIVVANY